MSARLAVGAAGVLAACACATGPPALDTGGTIDVGEALGAAGSAGFARATEPRPFVFPDDHGPHESFRTEWWYYTGNLADEAGAEFGFQLTIFRHALAPQIAGRSSAWAARDVWFAHFALGDAARGRFTAFERFERGARALAGARPRPFAAWVGDWRVESADGAAAFPMRLSAAEGDVALALELDPGKPLVLQGERGWSRKGPEPGNASYYYSATRLAAEGVVTVGATSHEVTGSAWLDREWSTSVLSAGLEGWDWFAIQLDDGRELMLYRLRRLDGGVDRFSSGTLVELDGTSRRMGAADVRYEPGRRWTSPRSGAAYPVEWRLTVEPLDLVLDVRPLLDACELNVAVRYWEGAIRVRGRQSAEPLTGRGFLEMTGYAGRERAGLTLQR